VKWVKFSCKSTSLEVTDNHPFWVEGLGWVESAKLKPGMVLKDVNNANLSLADLKAFGRTETTYNFTVADFHTYFAGPQKAFVHNACACTLVASNWKSVKQFGHTFSRHGEGAKNTENLLGRAKGTGGDQGQWINNAKAAEVLSKFTVDKITEVRIPEGVGQVIKADGSIVSAEWARIMPSATGVKTAYPIIPK